MFEIPCTITQEQIPNRIGLIDADCIAYWAAAGCDEMVADAAYRRVNDRLEMIKDQIQTREVRNYLTGEGNFRNDVATVQQYKGNRYDKNGKRIKPQPKWLAKCRQYIIDHHAGILCHGQEADDALSIAQIKCNASKTYHSIISSIDKDLRIIPGLHHDMNSGEIDTTTELGELHLDEKGKLRGSGLRFFYAQLLMGDSADWIPGLPKTTTWMKDTYPDIKRLGGCGPSTAYAVLNSAEDERELLQRVFSCYESYWDGERSYVHWRTGETVCPTALDMLREQGNLLWMRRSEGDTWEPRKDLIDACNTE